MSDLAAAARLGRAAQRRHPCRPSRRHRARAGLPARCSFTPASTPRAWGSLHQRRAAVSSGWCSCPRYGRKAGFRPSARSPRRTRPRRPTPMAARSSKASSCSHESGVPFTVLRPAVVYGKGVKGNIAALATLARTPMPLPFAGFDNRRSLLARDNLVSAIALTLGAREAAERDLPRRRCRADQRGRPRRGDAGRSWPRPSSRQDAARRDQAADGIVRPRGRLGAHLGRFVIDASKLMRIGWRPSIATREGIIAMMRSGNGAGA